MPPYLAQAAVPVAVASLMVSVIWGAGHHYAWVRRRPCPTPVPGDIGQARGRPISRLGAAGEEGGAADSPVQRKAGSHRPGQDVVVVAVSVDHEEEVHRFAGEIQLVALHW